MTSWTAPAYQRIAALLGERTGLAFSAARVADAEAGVRRAMSRAGTAEVAAYLGALEGGRADLDALIEELTVGGTYFFREPLQWALLRDQVLPELARARAEGDALRLWSAGCASGEEAYTLAIVLDEMGIIGAEILATDLSRAALEKARAAVYGPWSLRGVDPSRVVSHFSPDGARWRLDERLRARVRFERLNLATDVYPSFSNGTWRMDVILCRNVLIYLDDATVRTVTHRLADCLAPGGWLLTGASDPVLDCATLEAITTESGIAYRKPAIARTAPSEDPAPSPRSGEGWGALPIPAPSNDGGLSPTLSAERRGSTDDPLTRARAAFARGDYEGARALASALPEAAAAVLCVRALANAGDTPEAQRLAEASTGRHPDCVELHLLNAVLLIDRSRYDEACQAARRALYLDRRLVIGHFLLGTALARVGDLETARKAFRNARTLCAPLPPDLPVPFADGQRAQGVAQAAAAQLQLLARSAS